MVAQGFRSQRRGNTSSQSMAGLSHTSRRGDRSALLVQRFWQPGQKKVARAPWTMRRTVVPQRTQAWPARP